MKALLVTAVLAAAAFTGTAHAAANDYQGGCTLVAVADPGPEQLETTTYRGIVVAAVVPTDPDSGLPTGADVAATCELRINGAGHVVLDAGSGRGAVAGAAPITYTVNLGDILELCETVTIDGQTVETCESLGSGCAPTVCEHYDLLDQVLDLIEETGPWYLVDQVLCAQLVSLAPVVDALPTAGVLSVDPVTGDTYAGGTTEDDLFWDCPPYTGTGS